MSSSLISQTMVPTGPLQAPSLTLLLKRGIEYFQQGRYTEGMTLLTLVHEHLPPDHEAYPVTLLETLMREYANYSQLQQMLQETSVRLIEAHTKLQASRTALSTLLLPLLYEISNEQTSHILRCAGGYLEQVPVENGVANPTLYAICLGPFEVSCLGVPLVLCSNRNGQAILRYLVTQSDHSATVDTLMALFWPEDSAEVALHKLQVTISILRRSLQAGYDHQEGYILYKHGVYQLNPSIALGSDVEDFLVLYEAGCKVGGRAAVSFYEQACSLYRRPFLVEDLYADWSFVEREHLRQIHLSMCSALTSHYVETGSYEQAAQWATTIIEGNRCEEAAYRQLMRIYALQGRRNDALREYQRCQQVLLDELGMQPMPETVALRDAIVRSELHY